MTPWPEGVLAALMLTACASRAPAREPLSPQRALEAQQRLAALRAGLATRSPRVERIAVRFDGRARLGISEARGAVAVAPPDALRMILTGPLGATALDLWIRHDLWRVAVPSLSLIRRGKGSPSGPDEALPIAFLRWWLLTPLEGALVDASLAVSPRGERFVLETSDGVVTLDVASPTGPFAAVREGPGGREEVIASAIPCGEVTYRQRARGLTVMVRCEAMDPGEGPDGPAFDDPDASGKRP